MIRPIVIYGDAVLREKCAPVAEVTAEIRALAQDLVETMIDADGVGLAAPQVGVPVQLAVIDVAHAADRQSCFRVGGRDAPVVDFMPLVFLNPRLEPGREKITDTEGCLSFPGLRYQITRFADVTAHLTLLDGREIVIETDGLLSRALQHETDHLHGRLFIDRLSAADKLGLKKRLLQMYDEIEEAAKKPQGANQIVSP
jgi:peptide deformylase